MITHEQAQKALRKAFDIDTPQGFTKDEYIELKNIIWARLKQQEKVSKLLELYQTLSRLDENFNDEDIFELKQQIKALEEELK